MQTLELVLVLLVAILVSAILEEALPRISLPLVQIALGVVVVLLFPSLGSVRLAPDLFLVLFIAPLLFDETRRTNKLELWRNKAPILSLAIGLVVLCMLAAGFALHWLEPSISLAAAFALGAALGPTDAVAVAALGKDIQMEPRIRALLSGEALLNDASGVVSFQFAIAAAVTGAFSALDAGEAFALSFVGGILLGIVLGVAIRWLRQTLRRNGLESTTVHVVLEVMIPFIVYLAAENIEVSGILAVVASGLILNTGDTKASPASARLNIASSSVWDVLVFAINGFVFVMLGMQLPLAIMPTWEDARFGTAGLIGIVLLITLAIVVVRFIWMLAIELAHGHKPQPLTPPSSSLSTEMITSAPADRADAPIDPFEDPLVRQKREEQARRQTDAIAPRALASKTSLATKAYNALIGTLAGPKGAVTLSIIFSIPLSVGDGTGFPYRDMLVFIASGVILVTLLLANFALPILAPRADSHNDDETREVEIKIIQNVIAELRNFKTPDNAKAVGIVIRRYRERIRRIRASKASSAMLRTLRTQVIARQEEIVHTAIVNKEVSKEAGQQYADRLKRLRKMSSRHINTSRQSARPWLFSTVAGLPAPLRKLMGKLGLGVRPMEDKEGFRKLMIVTERGTVTFLEEQAAADDEELAQAAALLLLEHRDTLAWFIERFGDLEGEQLFSPETAPLIGITEVVKKERMAASLHMQEVEAEGFRLELEQIQDMREKGLLSRSAARDLREEVYLMQIDRSDAL